MTRRRAIRTALGVAVVGSAVVALGVVIDPRQALTSYLFAYAGILTIVLGALLMIMIGHLTGARWFVPFRGVAIAIAATLPAMALLALPILAGVRAIYPWVNVARLAPGAQAIVARKHAWLNVPFFLSRAVLYHAVWIVFGELMRALSRKAASESDNDAGRSASRLRKASAGGSIAVGLTLTFAAFDWLMSLEPSWYSTVYGIYVFAGGILAALGLIALLSGLRNRDPQPTLEETEQIAALGKLLLTFTIFWGYIGFSQYLIIWIADVPLEVSWYVTRTGGSWGVVALVIAVGQFAIPFTVLLSRTLKRNPRVLAWIGAWLVFIHVVDMYWLVLPALHPSGLAPSWTDVAALVAVGGFVVAGAVWRARDLSFA